MFLTCKLSRIQAKPCPDLGWGLYSIEWSFCLFGYLFLLPFTHTKILSLVIAPLQFVSPLSSLLPYSNPSAFLNLSMFLFLFQGHIFLDKSTASLCAHLTSSKRLIKTLIRPNCPIFLAHIASYLACLTKLLLVHVTSFPSVDSAWISYHHSFHISFEDICQAEEKGKFYPVWMSTLWMIELNLMDFTNLSDKWWDLPPEWSFPAWVSLNILCRSCVIAHSQFFPATSYFFESFTFWELPLDHPSHSIFQIHISFCPSTKHSTFSGRCPYSSPSWSNISSSLIYLTHYMYAHHHICLYKSHVAAFILHPHYALLFKVLVQMTQMFYSIATLFTPKSLNYNRGLSTHDSHTFNLIK